MLFLHSGGFQKEVRGRDQDCKAAEQLKYRPVIELFLDFFLVGYWVPDLNYNSTILNSSFASMYTTKL